jgi:hypothetical protein
VSSLRRKSSDARNSIPAAKLIRLSTQGCLVVCSLKCLLGSTGCRADNQSLTISRVCPHEQVKVHCQKKQGTERSRNRPSLRGCRIAVAVFRRRVNDKPRRIVCRHRPRITLWPNHSGGALPTTVSTLAAREALHNWRGENFCSASGQKDAAHDSTGRKSDEIWVKATGPRR